MPSIYDALLKRDPSVPFVPHDGQFRAAATNGPSAPELKGKHGKQGGNTRRRGAGMMDKLRELAVKGSDELDDAEDDRIVGPREFSRTMGKAMNDVGPMMAQMAELRKMKETMREANEGGARKTRRVSKNRGDIVVAMMEIRDQIKVYHWQTSKYARHIATNDLVASLDTNIDQFVEVYMGKYGRPKITKTIKLHNFSESAARAFVAKQTEFLTTKMPKMLKSTDSDLLNIRDTILADVNKTLYLFTLA